MNNPHSYLQVVRMRAFLDWLGTYDEAGRGSYYISSMQGGAIHVKFFIDAPVEDDTEMQEEETC